MDPEPLTHKADQTPTRQDACILADAWLVLWKADELHCLDISRLEIKVRSCILWLEGRVRDPEQCRLAERLLKAIDRVKAVNNELSIEE